MTCQFSHLVTFPKSVPVQLPACCMHLRSRASLDYLFLLVWVRVCMLMFGVFFGFFYSSCWNDLHGLDIVTLVLFTSYWWVVALLVWSVSHKRMFRCQKETGCSPRFQLHNPNICVLVSWCSLFFQMCPVPTHFTQKAYQTQCKIDVRWSKKCIISCKL